MQSHLRPFARDTIGGRSYMKAPDEPFIEGVERAPYESYMTTSKQDGKRSFVKWPEKSLSSHRIAIASYFFFFQPRYEFGLVLLSCLAFTALT